MSRPRHTRHRLLRVGIHHPIPRPFERLSYASSLETSSSGMDLQVLREVLDSIADYHQGDSKNYRLRPNLSVVFAVIRLESGGVYPVKLL